ncbi:MAG: DUF3106 domain-containing protein [Desulfococcaceae bacterium]|jgi:hypothetical protein|nr:DUF3106 domain-containing protein [Desulfococcaceae bacterium]
MKNRSDSFHMTMKNALIPLFFLLLCSAFPPGASAGPAGDISIAGWLAFQHPEMRTEDYEKLSPAEKARLKKKLEEWQSLPPEKQAEIRQKMKRLKKMPPEARQLYQRRFRQWQRLSPAEQQQTLRQLENWDSLSPEERQRVRQRFR